MTLFRNPIGPIATGVPKAAEAWVSLSRLRKQLDPMGLLSPKQTQAVLLSTFVLYGRAHEYVLNGQAASHAEAPEMTTEEVSQFTGLEESEQLAALEGLSRAGIVRFENDRWGISAEALLPDPQRSRIRWDRIVQKLAKDNSALLVVWCLADLIVPPWTLLPVSKRSIERATLLSVNTVRSAQRRLVAEGLVERVDGPPGTTPHFAFTAKAFDTKEPEEPAVDLAEQLFGTQWKGGVLKIGTLEIELPDTGPSVRVKLDRDSEGRLVWRIAGLEIHPK